MALDFTKYFGQETEEISWKVLLKYFRRIYYFYSETDSSQPDLTFSPLPAPTTSYKGFRVTKIIKNNHSF